MTIGSNALTPEFDPDVTEYTTVTTNTTNKVTATAASSDAVITISLTNSSGTSTLENGTAATWADGENVLTVKIDGKTTYTVTVTKN